MTDITYTDEFEYSHKNPYHERLEEFSEFVLRDQEGESLRGKWNSDSFKRDAPLHVEIGSGYGHFMIHYCTQNPEVNFVGIDYRFKRSFQLAKKLARLEVINFRYLRAKGERINFLFAKQEIQRLYYFFPDPWPKKKHQKKRLFQLKFLDDASKSLSCNGEIWIKTDHLDYALHMEDVIKNHPHFELIFKTFDMHKNFPKHELAQFKTKFEKIFIDQKIPIKAFIIRKIQREK